MKKVIAAVVLICLMGNAALAESVVTLYAGQNIDVGNVTISNDDENLYVTLNTDGDWRMCESHVHVATSIDEIPQRNGNPIPGKFDYSEEHDPKVNTYTYTIPLGSWGAGDDLCIAVHAAAAEQKQLVLVSTAGEGTVAVSTEGPYVGFGTPEPPVEATYSPWGGFDYPLPSGATWINSGGTTETNGEFGSWRRFVRQFLLSEDASDIVATITLTSDNIEDVGLNDAWVGLSEYSNDWIFRVYDVGMVTYLDPYAWRQVKSYSVTPQPGDNTLEILVRNYPGGQNARYENGNPTGLIYKLVVDYYEGDESAWSDGTPFEGRNWATCTTYTLPCPHVVGDWYVELYTGATLHDRFLILNSQVDGDIGGFLGVGTDPDSGTVTGNITGTVECTAITMHYDREGYVTTGYTADLVGTIAPDGNSMSGTWTDSNQYLAPEDWNATRLP